MRKRAFYPGHRKFIPMLTFLLAVCATAMLQQRAEGAERGGEASITCNIHQGPCITRVSDSEVLLDIIPKPVKAMEDLTFRVVISGAKPVSSPYIDLGMPGMNMGPNRIRLKPVNESTYEGRGTIVRCPSGRRTWKAIVTLPGMGAVDYLFDVIY